MGQAYASLIAPSLPVLLRGLSDDDEQVREVALRAGRVLVRCHGKHHVDKILPTLELGMENADSVRIRLSSLSLLGDMLALIGNTKVGATDATNTQEEVRSAERAQAHIALALGKRARSRILAGLYLSRSDSASAVRQNALLVWKSVVSVTARTLKEILPTLLDKVVNGLGSADIDKTEVAARCMGDVVIKLGETNTLPNIVPLLDTELKKATLRKDVHARRGVCVGLAHLLDSCSKESVDNHIDRLVALVRNVLCDTDPDVRFTATASFQRLYHLIGQRALEEIVPSLFVKMDQSSLHGLIGILSVRSKELLPYLVPKLLTPPITVDNANAIAKISEVASTTIYSHFHTIVPAILLQLSTVQDEPDRESAIRDSFRSLCRTVDPNGLRPLVSEISSKIISDKPQIRLVSCWAYAAFVEESPPLPLLPIVYRDLVRRLNDSSTQVLREANLALAALAKQVPPEELLLHAAHVRDQINSMISDIRRRKGGVGEAEFFLPGLNIPKGLEPFLPMYQRGILFGTPDQRETCASGLGELIALASPKFLPPALIVKMTGPLLRIVGERNPSQVKVAIVQTLALILTKGGKTLRAFVPQFQTTFVKALSDPSRTVRTQAVRALSLLVPLSTRLDPLLKELSNLADPPDSHGNVAVQGAALEALAVVLRHGGDRAKLPASVPDAVRAALALLLAHPDADVRESAARVLGAAHPHLPQEERADSFRRAVLLDPPADEDHDDRERREHGSACACFYLLRSSPDDDPVPLRDLALLAGRRVAPGQSPAVRAAGCVALGAVLAAGDRPYLPEIAPKLLSIVGKNPGEEVEVHRGLAKALCHAELSRPKIFSGKGGLPIVDAAVRLAMCGVQRVQTAFNDFLWLLFVSGKDEREQQALVEEYVDLASFENGRAIKSLVAKVLKRIKDVDIDQM